MDYTLFLQVVAWPVAVVYGILTLFSLYNAYTYEVTYVGRLQRRVMALEGTRIKGYFFWRRCSICLVAIALLISLN